MIKTELGIFGEKDSPCKVDMAILKQLPAEYQEFLLDWDYFLFYKRHDGEVKICLSALGFDEEYFDDIEDIKSWLKEEVALTDRG